MKKLMVLILSTLMLLSCGKTGEVSNKNTGNKDSGANETYPDSNSSFIGFS